MALPVMFCAHLLRTGIEYLQYTGYQGCGPGSGLDPDSKTLWIRIRIGNPDHPDPGARKLRNFSGKNALFGYFLKKLYH
jgi:hypothetical protein